MPYLIDGHNLISYLDDIDLSDPNDEAKLVLKLRGYCAGSRKRCIVIFDNGLPGGTSSLTTPSVKVVFASANQTNADRIIMERIRHTPDAGNWTVVSSDNEILAAAQAAGMRGMRCVDFAAIVNKPEASKPHPGIDANVRLSEKEIAEWLDVFGLDAPLPDDTPPQPRQRPKPENPPQKAETPPERKQPKNEMDEWLRAFGGETERKPTDKAARIQPRREPPQKAESAPEEKAAAPKENTVDSWLEIFGEGQGEREPTDPAPQRSRPEKQGQFGKDKRREPNVHPGMGLAEEIYLSDGEIEAWLRLFGEEDED